MARTDPKRWTKEEIERLIEMSGKEDATLESLAKYYHLSPSSIASTLRRAGVNNFFTEKRKQRRLNEIRKEKLELIRDLLLRNNGRITDAAREGNYSRSSIERWARILFSKEELENMVVRRACVECGRLVISNHPHAKMCSDECKKTRSNKLRQKLRNCPWQLWQKRDYDEFVTALSVCGGSVHKAAKMMGVSRYTAHSAVSRWGLRDFIASARENSMEQKIEQAAELIKNGLSMVKAARKLQIDKNKIKEELINKGHGHLLNSQKCVCCQKVFRRQKVQDRCCSEECRTKLKKERFKKIKAKKNKKIETRVVVENELIKRSKYL